MKTPEQNIEDVYMSMLVTELQEKIDIENHKKAYETAKANGSYISSSISSSGSPNTSGKAFKRSNSWEAALSSEKNRTMDPAAYIDHKQQKVFIDHVELLQVSTTEKPTDPRCEANEQWNGEDVCYIKEVIEWCAKKEIEFYVKVKPDTLQSFLSIMHRSNIYWPDGASTTPVDAKHASLLVMRCDTGMPVIRYARPIYMYWVQAHPENADVCSLAQCFILYDARDK